MRNTNTNNNTFAFDGDKTIRSVNDASCLFGQYIARELEKIGMRASYRHLMKPLMENESLTQLELVKLTGLKAPTISITLRNMERDGIVRREKNDNDRRETHVYITDLGRQMHEKLLLALEEAERIMVRGISDKELDAARKATDKMCANLRAELEG